MEPVTHAIGRRAIERVAISPDGRLLAAYCPEGFHLVLRPLRDAGAPGVRVGLQSRSPYFAFAPDRPLLVVGDSNFLKGCDPTAAQPELVGIGPDVIYPVGALALTADGRTAIVARPHPYVTAGRAGVECCDITPGAPPAFRWRYNETHGHDLPPRGLGLLSGEKAFAVVERVFDKPNNGYFERVVIHDAATGERRSELLPPANVPKPKYEVHALVTNPRKLQVAGVVLGHIVVWNARAKSREQWRVHRPEEFVDLAFHPNGKSLFAATRAGVFRYDTQQFAESRLEVAIPGQPSALTVSADGKTLAVGTREGTVKVCEC